MSAVILRDEIIHYEVLGRGRPLLFIHGWVGSWRYWIPNMQAASLSYRAYALDLWGFGDSAKNSGCYSLEQQSLLLDEFIDSMGIGRIALIGHGLGALVAMLYTQRHPDRVDRIMVVGYPCAERAISPRLYSASPTELAEWLFDRVPSNENARTEIYKADPGAIQASLSDAQQANLPEIPKQIGNPLLLVHGSNDPAIAPPDLDEIALWSDNTHCILFDQSGHYPMLDETRKFNRLLTDFLVLNSGSSPRELQLKEEWKRRVR
jgi:pimeloyl-ACP methyl ester carboxylesterase